MKVSNTKKENEVASFTDAWIEIYATCQQTAHHHASHPLRMRGLKFPSFTEWGNTLLSHPLRMRGLKSTICCGRSLIVKVASFTDAWIEIRIKEEGVKKVCVASFTDAWIEILHSPND